MATSFVKIKTAAIQNSGGIILFGSIFAAFISGIALTIYFMLAYRF